MVVLGCAILGIGIFTEVHADVIMLPGEGFVKAVSVTLDKEFGATKVGVDISLTVIAIIISLVMFRQIKGVGIGTVIAAVITGMLSNFFGKLLSPFVDAFLAKKEKETDIQPEAVAAAEEQEQKRIVITIGRQYGCRAAEIGKILAEKLGINYYDKDLVDMVAEESGLTAEYVMKYQEKLTNSFLYDLYKTTFAITNNEQSRIDAMHYAEEKVIKRITSQESCVIMGRVANFALDDNENAFHVFLYTTPEEAVKNVMLQDGLDRGEAEKKIRHVNTKRSNYYRQFAKKEWGRADSYDLTINTGHYTVEKTADVILNVMHDCGKLK
jgi:cytidylate kinase